MLGATDPIAARIEDLQEVVAQGPTQHAFINNQPAEFIVSGAEFGTPAQWDRFAEALHDLFGR